MAYAVNNTRGTLLVSLADNTIDTTTTDVSLIGKNTSNYGEVQNENFVGIMENFAASTAPTSPLEGQLWYDVTNKTLNHYRVVGNNTGWVSTTNSIATAAPSSLLRKDGDTWYDSTNKQLRAFNVLTAQWDLVGPDYDKDQLLSGQKILTVVDDFAGSHYVIGWYINNQLYAMVSKDAEFALSGYPGFTAANIFPGINFSTSFGALLTGGSGGGLTVDNAQTLDSLDSTQFIRADVADSANGVVTFANTTDSTTVGTGAAVVVGGVGVAKSIVVGGAGNKFTNVAASTNTTTGAVTLAGGMGVAGNIYAGAIQGTPIGTSVRSTGSFTTLTANGTVTITTGTPSTSTITGAGVITGGIGVSGNIFAGALQGTPVGSITRSTVAATTLTASGATTLTAGTGSTSTGTGSLVITGGLGVSENIWGGGILNIAGTGTFGGAVTAPSFSGSLSGTATGASTITITDETSSASTFKPLFTDAAGSGKVIKIDSSGLSYQPSTNTMTATTFAGALSGTAAIASNVTITDTIAAGTYYVNFADGASGSRAVRTHSGGLTYNPTAGGTLTTGTFSGTSTQAQYADLAEKYESDSFYEVGTVVVFGGEKEITVTDKFSDTRVAGVISAAPAYLMNSGSDGLPVALRGKVLVKVIGFIEKGDLLVSSSTPGLAESVGDLVSHGHAVFAKSLESHSGSEEKTIHAVII